MSQTPLPIGFPSRSVRNGKAGREERPFFQVSGGPLGSGEKNSSELSDDKTAVAAESGHLGSRSGPSDDGFWVTPFPLLAFSPRRASSFLQLLIFR